MWKYLNNGINDLEEGEIEELVNNKQEHTEAFNLAQFIKYRFGYDIASPAVGTSKIEPSAKAEEATFVRAMRALSFETPTVSPSVEDSIMSLVRILSNSTRTFTELPCSFDYTDGINSISLESESLRISLVTENDGSVRYLLTCNGYVDEYAWGILVPEASTVLFIYRYRLQTMSDIALKLATHGIKFHTVVAADAERKPQPAEAVRGLGLRPHGYKPTKADYSEYLRRRRELLTGPKGRAALMHGGIVARIARDVLGLEKVLTGPSEGAVTVGKHGQLTLHDDMLSENDTNIICGMYFFDVEAQHNARVAETDNFISGTKAQMSYWPKDTTWNSVSAYILSEWTEGAEKFYQKRKGIMENDYEPIPANGWRRILRVQNFLTKQIEAGAERFQSEFLQTRCLQMGWGAEHC